MRKGLIAVMLVFALAIAGSAQADSILFPWVIKDNAISTLISLVNTADPGTRKVRYHLIYEYKASTANGQTEKCDEYDFCVPTSFNDVLVFDAAANFNNGAALFGDTGAGAVTYKTVQANNSLALPVDGPRRAFLIVTNEIYTTQQCGMAEFVGVDNSLYGEAMVVDISNGAAWGYRAYNPNRDAGDWLNFSDNNADPTALPSDAYGEVLDGADEMTQVVLLPPNNFCTKMFVTPVHTNQWLGNLGSQVYFFCSEDDNITFTGIFNDDEDCISFHKPKKVVCTDASLISHYISSGAWITFVNSGGPGWAYVGAAAYNSVAIPTVGTPEVVVGKLEYRVGGTQIDGGSIDGTINNFIWLRAHATEEEGATPGGVTGCPGCEPYM